MKTRLALLLAISALPLLVHASTSAHRSPSQFHLPTAREAARNPVLARLESLASRLPDFSVESFLAELKKTNPSHFRHYSSVYGSRSLHQAIFEAPRIILHGQDYVDGNSYYNNKG